MLRSRWFAAGALAVVIGLFIASLSRTPRAVSAPAPDTEQASFRGKVLLVRSGFGMETHILEQVRVRHFGYQSFLLGKVIESTGSRNVLKGKTVWLNMTGITQMIECEDAAAAKKTLKSLPQAIGYGAPVMIGESIPSTTTPTLPPAAPAPPDALPAPTKR